MSLLPWKRRRRKGYPQNSGPWLPVAAQSCSRGWQGETQPCKRLFLGCARENRAAGDPTHAGHLVRSLPTALHPETSHPSHTAQAALAVPTQSLACGTHGVCQQLTAACDTTRCLQLGCGVLPLGTGSNSHPCSSSRGSSAPQIHSRPFLPFLSPERKMNLMVCR